MTKPVHILHFCTRCKKRLKHLLTVTVTREENRIEAKCVRCGQVETQSMVQRTFEFH